MPEPLFVAFDLETTGFRALTDRIVEIGAVKFTRDGTVIDRFTSLVNPHKPCTPGAFAAHGITDAELAEAPEEIGVLADFAAWVGIRVDTTLMAHNLRFDKAFLLAGFGRNGISQPPALWNPCDTLALARSRWPHFAAFNLSALANRMGLDAGDMHRAPADAERVRLIWLMAQNFKG